MNVLDICKTVAYKTGVAAPTSLFGSTARVSLQFLHLLYESAQYLRNQRVFPQQKRSQTITTVSGTDSYDLKDDFYAMLPGAQWNTETSLRLVGPESDATFSGKLYGSESSTYVSYRIFGPDLNTGAIQSKIVFDPTPPTTGDEYVVEYVTKSLFLPTTWTSADFTAYDTITADTNICIFDDDVIVAELLWRYLKAKGQDYQEEQAQAMRLIDQAISRWRQTYRGRMDRDSNRGRYSVPPGSWSF